MFDGCTHVFPWTLSHASFQLIYLVWVRLMTCVHFIYVIFYGGLIYYHQRGGGGRRKCIKYLCVFAALVIFFLPRVCFCEPYVYLTHVSRKFSTRDYKMDKRSHIFIIKYTHIRIDVLKCARPPVFKSSYFYNIRN